MWHQLLISLHTHVYVYTYTQLQQLSHPRIYCLAGHNGTYLYSWLLINWDRRTIWVHEFQISLGNTVKTSSQDRKYQIYSLSTAKVVESQTGVKVKIYTISSLKKKHYKNNQNKGRELFQHISQSTLSPDFAFSRALRWGFAFRTPWLCSSLELNHYMERKVKPKDHELKASLGYKVKQRSQKGGKKEKVNKELGKEKKDGSHKNSIKIKEKEQNRKTDGTNKITDYDGQLWPSILWHRTNYPGDTSRYFCEGWVSPQRINWGGSKVYPQSGRTL